MDPWCLLRLRASIERRARIVGRTIRYSPLANRAVRVELRLAGGLEQDRFERLGGALAGPDDELECLIVAFAGVERRAERRLALQARGRDAAGEQEGVAEHHQPVGEP